ncbi:MAG: hypothetical protein ACHREM_29810 [Polyangiales bacterium]
MGTMRWQPPWWNDSHASAWERVKESLRRDWEQTMHDLHVDGGHQLNQSASDTVRQASGREDIPLDDRPNPPKVVGSWDDVEVPLEYGYGARAEYGQAHDAWSRDLEDTLKREWESAQRTTGREWDDVRDQVRRGYEYRR